MYDNEKKCHVLKIDEGPFFKGFAPDYQPIFEGELQAAFIDFVGGFLKQASPYFSKPLDQDIFIQRIRHIYSTDESLLKERLQSISWIPAQVLFYPSRYEFHWIIGEIEKETVIISPGTDLIEAEIQPSDRPLTQSEQRRIRQRVRQARLKCALARLYLERLTEKYYTKYGNFDGLNGSDSELSSEMEFRENEAPRKI